MRVGHLARVGRQHFDHPARSAHDDLGAPLQLGDLLGYGGAAVDADAADALERAQELLHLPADLRAELPRRRHDDGDGAVALLQLRLRRDVPEEGQEEGQRLPAPRLGDADHVPPAHDDGDGLRLDRRRLLEVVALQDLEDARADAALRPRLDRLGHHFPLHLDAVHVQAVLLHLPVRHLGQLGHLAVKVLLKVDVLDLVVVDLGDVLLPLVGDLLHVVVQVLLLLALAGVLQTVLVLLDELPPPRRALRRLLLLLGHAHHDHHAALLLAVCPSVRLRRRGRRLRGCGSGRFALHDPLRPLQLLHLLRDSRHVRVQRVLLLFVVAVRTAGAARAVLVLVLVVLQTPLLGVVDPLLGGGHDRV